MRNDFDKAIMICEHSKFECPYTDCNYHIDSSGRFRYSQDNMPDYCNIGGLQQYDEDTGEWEDWLYDDGESFYESDSLDEYCEEKSSQAKELEDFSRYLFSQVRFEYEC